MAETGLIHHDDIVKDDSKRDFIFLAAGGLGAVGAASVPWVSLGVIFGVILLIGLTAGFVASRRIGRVPMLDALRG